MEANHTLPVVCTSFLFAWGTVAARTCSGQSLTHDTDRQLPVIVDCTRAHCFTMQVAPTVCYLDKLNRETFLLH